MTKHRVTTAILGTLITATGMFILLLLFNSSRQMVVISSFVLLLVLGGVLIAHLRGWRWSRETTTLALMLGAFATVSPGYLSENLFISLFTCVAVAAALLSPVWALVVFAGMLIGALVIVGVGTGSLTPELLGPTFRPENLLVITVTAIGIAAVSGIARRSQHIAEANARRAEEERTRAEQQAADLTQANERMAAQLDQQRELLDLVATLEMPAVSLADGVVFVPIVGHIDNRRAQALMSRLLQETSAQRARMVIIDIAGISVIDTAVARALLDTAQALRLLGCEIMISGISASVAITLTQLGVSLEGVGTVRSPQEALRALKGQERGLAGGLSAARAT